MFDSVICNCECGGYYELSAEDAHLMAVAPDLLYYLKMILNRFDPVGETEQDIAQEAQNLIEQIEGGSK
jgi:hypothetical protein